MKDLNPAKLLLFVMGSDFVKHFECWLGYEFVICFDSQMRSDFVMH